jgi:hypothetical protein
MVMAFGLFFELLPQTTSPHSFFEARNSRDSTFSKGWIFSFFLFRRTE